MNMSFLLRRMGMGAMRGEDKGEEEEVREGEEMGEGQEDVALWESEWRLEEREQEE